MKYLEIVEIFKSLQGESLFAGLPCIFVRLSRCNLRCSWCDTVYSFGNGDKVSLDFILNKIRTLNCNLVEFTGGEPLLQKAALIDISRRLISERKTVLLETNGTLSLEGLPAEIVKIVDYKLSSACSDKGFDYNNFNLMQGADQLKFVVDNLDDYNELKKVILDYNLEKKPFQILVSKTQSQNLSHSKLADLIVKDNLNVRYQIQMHKIIWDDARGK